MAGFKRVVVSELTWEIPEIYDIVQPINRGSYGQVASVRLRNNPGKFAMKKLLRPFESAEDAKRVYREIRLLKHMNHRNLIFLLDTFHPPSPHPNPSWDDFQEVYFVTHLMQQDLHTVTRRVNLTHNQVRAILFQILKGLKYIHSAGVLHRDLKPGNIAVNDNLELRILDFGMARLSGKDMTQPVCTLWYRAPELLFGCRRYSKAIDMWSVGCILAELISSRPLFQGRHLLDQIRCVINVMGNPSEEFIAGIHPETRRDYVRSFPETERRDFRDIFPSASPSALDLLNKLLEMIPERRITVEEAMRHPYFEGYRDPYFMEIDTAPTYDQNFEDNNQLTINCWKELIVNEIRNFRPPPDLINIEF